jgi:hypothetical protein
LNFGTWSEYKNKSTKLISFVMISCIFSKYVSLWRHVRNISDYTEKNKNWKNDWFHVLICLMILIALKLIKHSIRRYLFKNAAVDKTSICGWLIEIHTQTNWSTVVIYFLYFLNFRKWSEYQNKWTKLVSYVMFSCICSKVCFPVGWYWLRWNWQIMGIQNNNHSYGIGLCLICSLVHRGHSWKPRKMIICIDLPIFWSRYLFTTFSF